jgi:hypothetical protein
MNKPLTNDELQKIAVDYPPPPLSMLDRLLHWATLIEAHGQQLRPVHEIEYWSRRTLATAAPVGTAFDLAASDPQLKAAGLISSAPTDIMRFFGMEMSALHYISCDCGGYISNVRMAERIRAYARTYHAPTELAPPIRKMRIQNRPVSF